MSARFRIIHTEEINGTEVTFRADIHDADFAGSVAEKLAFDRFFEWDYEKLNERDPFENPVQGSSLTIDLAVLEDDNTELDLLTDLLGADESRFHIEFYINDVHKWSGPILTDLLDYPEAPRPFTAQIEAKDTSRMKGADFDFVVLPTLTRLSEIIAECLKTTGLDLPIRSYTNLTNNDAGINTAEDFLYALYHQKLAFQERGEPFKCMDVLTHICRAYNLIIRQADARWIVEQLPAVAKGDDVQFDYDSDGLNPVSSTPDRTISIDGSTSFIIETSRNKITSPLKEVTSVYKHRVPIFNVPTEDVSHDSSLDETVFRLGVEENADQKFSISLDAEVVVSDPSGSMTGEAFFRVLGRRAGGTTLYLDQATGQWSAGEKEVAVDVAGSTASLTGSLEIPETDSMLEIISIRLEFVWAEAVTQLGGGSTEPRTVSEVNFTEINAFVYNIEDRDWDAAIKHKFSRSGEYSVVEEIGETVLGDGPTGGDNLASKGRPAFDDFDEDQLDPGGFIIRGESTGVTLEELRLRERMSMRHTSLRNLLATLWINYSPENLISYDGETWFFLGGNMIGKGSTWTTNILRLDYSRQSGTFQAIVKSGGDPDTGGVSGSSSTPGSGSGLTVEEADELYFQQENLFSEIAPGDRSTARGNLDLGATDDVVFASIENTGGKFLSDNLFAFRNLADNAYQDIQARDANFRDLEVSGTINYVNEDNLQVEDKTITVNKNGTDVSAVNAGLIVERPSGNKSFLWVDDYWLTSSGMNIADLTATTGEFTGQVNVSDGAFLWKRDTEHEINLTTPLGETGIVFDSNELGDRSRFDILNASNATTASRYFEFGFNDQGGQVRIYNDNRIELLDETTIQSNLFVQGGLFANEFVVQQTRLLAEQIFGPMGAKIESVSGSAGSETITLSNEFGAGNPFSTGAFIKIQSRTGQSSGTIVKRLLRKVASISGQTATLTTTGVNDEDGSSYSTGDDVGSIASGDHAVGWGHATDATLDHYIHFDVANVTIPAIRFFDEVTNFDAGFEPLRVGGMSGFDAAITGSIGIAGATKTDGAVFWITEDEARLGNWLVKGKEFTQSFGTQGRINLTSDNTDMTSVLGYTATSANGLPFIGMFHSHDSSTGARAAIAIGETLDEGWTNSIGFSFVPSKDAAAYFRVDRNVSTGVITARLASSYFDATDLWGGSATKANATVRLDFANGQIFADAVSDVVWSRTELAGFSFGDEASDITDQEWKETINRSTNGQSQTDSEKIITLSKKRYGKNKLVFTGVGRQDGTGSGTATVERDVEIRANVSSVSGAESASGSVVIAQTSDQEFSFEVDISAIPDNDLMLIEIALWVSVTISNSDANTYGTQGFLREDVVIMTST